MKKVFSYKSTKEEEKEEEKEIDMKNKIEEVTNETPKAVVSSIHQSNINGSNKVVLYSSLFGIGETVKFKFDSQVFYGTILGTYFTKTEIKYIISCPNLEKQPNVKQEDILATVEERTI